MIKKISYTLHTSFVNEEGTEIITKHQKSMTCDNESQYQDALRIAKIEAYDGKYTVEDIPDPPPTGEEIMRQDVTALETALCEHDMAAEQRMADMETALCELDMGGAV